MDKQEFKDLDNTGFVTYLMENGIYGPLTQSFVIEAIRFYCERVTALSRPDSDPKEFIDPQLWYDIASWTDSQIKQKYES